MIKSHLILDYGLPSCIVIIEQLSKNINIFTKKNINLVNLRCPFLFFNSCHLLSTLLAIVLILSGIRLAVFASDEIVYEVVCIDECGDISYETIPATSEELSDCSSNGIVVLNDTPSTLQANNTLATTSSTSLEDVSVLSVSFPPYKYMCLIQATFPDGTKYRSSGILISKNLVLASAHGVYQEKYGGAATNAVIGIGTYFSGSEEIYQGDAPFWSGAIMSEYDRIY